MIRWIVCPSCKKRIPATYYSLHEKLCRKKEEKEKVFRELPKAKFIIITPEEAVYDPACG